ncbi:2-isopropylmalate synthase [compost metagenome]
MKWREEKEPRHWSVPYLLIDPKDIGREYEGDIIRINSQSGKGGIGYVLQLKYGLDLPAKMRENFGYFVKNVSDQQQKELMPEEIYDIFMKEYVNISTPVEFIKYRSADDEGFQTVVTIRTGHEVKEMEGTGNGRLDAISNALQSGLGMNYTDLIYSEHALETGSKSQAVSYIGITASDGRIYWGCGIDVDIMTSSVKALFSAVNQFSRSARR